MPGFTHETSAVRWKAWSKNGCQKSLSFRYMFISFQYIWKMYLDTLSHRVLVFPDFLLLKFSPKKFSWNNKMIPLLGIMNKNWKWQNHAFYYSHFIIWTLQFHWSNAFCADGCDKSGEFYFSVMHKLPH